MQILTAQPLCLLFPCVTPCPSATNADVHLAAPGGGALPPGPVAAPEVTEEEDLLGDLDDSLFAGVDVLEKVNAAPTLLVRQPTCRAMHGVHFLSCHTTAPVQPCPPHPVCRTHTHPGVAGKQCRTSWRKQTSRRLDSGRRRPFRRRKHTDSSSAAGGTFGKTCGIGVARLARCRHAAAVP